MTNRLTQRDIARLAKVSQTTVSLVLNNRTAASARIPAETRDRVLKVIRETGYVADPLARRLLQQRNQILGVFTYESVFPSASADFYHPFLSGIEESAEELGCDLLLFTSAPVTDGRRRVFHENNRLRIADGSLLLGRRIPAEELSRLVAEKYPFVSVGRRDDPELPDARATIPYVGADYVSATATVTARALQLGHERLAFVGPGEGAESSADRLRGFHQIASRGLHLSPADRELGDVLDELLARQVTAVFVEDLADAATIAEASRQRGLDVPGDLSVVALGDASRPVPSDADYSGFHIPRKEMGRQAVGLLEAILSGEEAETQQLLSCELVEGSTLAKPKGS
ncbi:DNA-binding LacI/PurR family transcriptional regulator [Kribbella orskensis]|uniref:DNA-binding LacI/PurR family transcriptional regulator n=1 Tax=Kribbella orskensis TaxID=2512216 RepID=A0ABY2BKI8_9ACTN|nr:MULTISPECIES: LacI family DNA-binding transcriptional regulator [Kribbella]TCN40363.1 DNA-binding LacI/PurR family transcriptional regulator [Kribbella sp. VKM Ac-2500]TCO22983.1 DNA-binding LacI/PurR family transcriptional regulator [Kribbella orskensis]